jgi:integrase
MTNQKRIRWALVFNRKGRLNEDGTALIQVRATKCRKSRFFSTGVWIEPPQWDDRHKTVRETHPHALLYNRQIAAKRDSLQEYEQQMVQRYGDCPLVLFDRYGKEVDDGRPESFTAFCWQETKRHGIAPGTRRKITSSVSKFQAFQRQVFFDELSLALVLRYDDWMHQQGLGLNTIDSHHRVLRAMINRAIVHDYVPADGNPYRKFKSRTAEPERVYLTAQELRKLEELELGPEHAYLDKWRKLFLIACYTGLRYQDVTRLAKRDVVEGDDGLEIHIRMEKTAKRITVPLGLLFPQDGPRSKPEAIILEAMAHGPRLDHLPLFSVTNQYYNRALKELAVLAGIEKRLTTHVARRTFATTMAPVVPPAILQRLMGHAKMSMTEIYIRLSNTEIKEVLKGLDWK